MQFTRGSLLAELFDAGLDKQRVRFNDMGTQRDIKSLDQIRFRIGSARCLDRESSIILMEAILNYTINLMLAV